MDAELLLRAKKLLSESIEQPETTINEEFKHANSCAVIKGSTLVTTYGDARSIAQRGAIVYIDGNICTVSTNGDWTSKLITLQEDYPGATKFDAIISPNAISINNKIGPTKLKKLKSNKSKVLDGNSTQTHQPADVVTSSTDINCMQSNVSNPHVNPHRPDLEASNKYNRRLNARLHKRVISNHVADTLSVHINKVLTDAMATLEDERKKRDYNAESRRKLVLARLRSKLQEDRQKAEQVLHEEQLARDMARIRSEEAAQALLAKTAERLAIRSIEDAEKEAGIKRRADEERQALLAEKERNKSQKGVSNSATLRKLRRETQERLRQREQEAKRRQVEQQQETAERLHKVLVESGRLRMAPPESELILPVINTENSGGSSGRSFVKEKPARNLSDCHVKPKPSATSIYQLSKQNNDGPTSTKTLSTVVPKHSKGTMKVKLNFHKQQLRDLEELDPQAESDATELHPLYVDNVITRQGIIFPNCSEPTTIQVRPHSPNACPSSSTPKAGSEIDNSDISSVSSGMRNSDSSSDDIRTDTEHKGIEYSYSCTKDMSFQSYNKTLEIVRTNSKSKVQKKLPLWKKLTPIPVRSYVPVPVPPR